MLKIIPIPAFQDNYIWLLHFEGNAIVIDPGDAAPVLTFLRESKLNLSSILITHHHDDHIGGVNALLNFKNVPVYAPAYRHYPFQCIPLNEGDHIEFPEIQQTFNVLWLPGHTLDHIAYVNPQYLFCGDVLFGAGCGKLFEGTPLQMLNSLNRLKQLPYDTKVFCTHEYTQKNIEFALTLEPDNIALQQRKMKVISLRQRGQPTLPSSIGLEIETNPYLRCKETTIIEFSKSTSHREIDVFTCIRKLRNTY